MPYRKIIDVYGPNFLDLRQAWNGGVRAIIHKASEGIDVHDNAYHVRKQQAMSMGFMWGAYHLSSAQDPMQQLDYFLEMEDGSNPAVLLALDWEESRQHGVMTLEQVRDFVTAFHQRLGRYPILYGGHTLRDSQAIKQGDPLLANCPLWYQRYRSTPVGLPTATWPRHTFWQYDDEQLQNGGFHIPGTGGADWNQFEGDLAALQSAWPFTGLTGVTGLRSLTAAETAGAVGPAFAAKPSAAEVAASAITDWNALWAGKRGADAWVKCIGVRGGYNADRRNSLGIYDDLFVRMIGGELTQWRGSTDPGQYYIDHPVNPRGCAQLWEGIHLFRPGIHQGQYPAFVQAEDFRVNRLDSHGNVQSVDFGEYGIHLHSGGPGEDVNRYSAGCQVIQSPEGYFGATWQRFFVPAAQAMHDHRQGSMPYMLIKAENLAQ
jgi:lysozyme